MITMATHIFVFNPNNYHSQASNADILPLAVNIDGRHAIVFDVYRMIFKHITRSTGEKFLIQFPSAGQITQYIQPDQKCVEKFFLPFPAEMVLHVTWPLPTHAPQSLPIDQSECRKFLPLSQPSPVCLL